ncbi:MAG: ECF transporter S component [Ruminiclostridium sp.]|nr:ECF transporter S component [Ruminiclostridium sp.]
MPPELNFIGGVIFVITRKTRALVLIGVLSGLAWVLMALEFPLFIYFPSYLKIDFSDVPAILGGIVLGPLAGVAVELVKNLLHFLTLSKEGGIGEIANFFAGAGLLIPIALIVRKDAKKLILGNIAGILSMTVVANLVNYFITLPLYMKNPPKEVIMTTILTVLIPFNLVKGIIVAIVVTVLYAALKKIIKKYRM